MNNTLWAEHLTRTNAALTLDLQRARVLLSLQRRRAEMWKHRALVKKAKR